MLNSTKSTRAPHHIEVSIQTHGQKIQARCFFGYFSVHVITAKKHDFFRRYDPQTSKSIASFIVGGWTNPFRKKTRQIGS